VQRTIDLIISVPLVIVSLPILLLAGAAVLIANGRPVLFRQDRVGQFGRHFQILKFRTMVTRNEGSLVTKSGDARVTGLGRFLRKYKLDELPQLWNVVRGEMSFIGPRPEVPRYVDPANDAWSAVHRVRPGITDLATLVYRDEERILAEFDDPERGYREVVLPAKLALNLEYIRRRSPVRDLKLLALTLRYSLMPGQFDPLTIRETVLPRNE
jgi:lipopolysaccharide/colanic/teichoic acid biosynthesis glycosyltransferase